MKDNNVSLNSMTGFSRKVGTFQQFSWTWEVRSVNAKSLDIRTRLPSGFDDLEIEIRNLATTRMKRGNISANLNLQKTQQAGSYRVNETLLLSLVESAERVQVRRDLKSHVQVEALMGIKGVVEHVEEQDEETLKDLKKEILSSLGVVLDDLVQVRTQEGLRLEEFICAQVNQIDSLCKEALETADMQPKIIQSRLIRQLNDLKETMEMDEDRIVQEAALLMTKADVREELDRIITHIAGARDLIGKGSPCGRKLDFLSQEFNREANTLCSKSQSTDLTKIGLELKSVIDQFREQIQNIE